jgi:hypothetical protein
VPDVRRLVGVDGGVLDDGLAPKEKGYGPFFVRHRRKRGRTPFPFDLRLEERRAI